VYRTYGDFQPLFSILAALAALILVSALAFPGERVAKPVPVG